MPGTAPRGGARAVSSRPARPGGRRGSRLQEAPRRTARGRRARAAAGPAWRPAPTGRGPSARTSTTRCACRPPPRSACRSSTQPLSPRATASRLSAATSGSGAGRNVTSGSSGIVTVSTASSSLRGARPADGRLEQVALLVGEPDAVAQQRPRQERRDGACAPGGQPLAQPPQQPVGQPPGQPDQQLVAGCCADGRTRDVAHAQLHHELDLDRRPQRQLGHADRRPRVPPRLAEHLGEQVRRAVEHSGLAGEPGRGRHEADHLHHARDGVEADQRVDRGEAR